MRRMTTELLEIQPSELKFTFELKKQSSCSIHLSNNSNEHVAFKVKTTSPKKYCVRPNTGIIKPNATCDFTVTMQAQRVAPLDLTCKDKFLIQSTVVRSETTEDEITSSMFTKDGEKYIEERKLRVLLISPSNSLILSPRNVETNQELSQETLVPKDHKFLGGLENVPPPLKNVNDDLEELHGKTVEGFGDEDEDTKKSKESLFLRLSKDFNDLTSKLTVVDSKLKEAELRIKKLTEEKNKSLKEKEVLKQELEMLTRKNDVTNVRVGFPLVFVFMVSMIGLAIGYFVRF